MPLESRFWVALNYPKIKKMKLTPQIINIRYRENNLDVVLFILSELVSPGFMSVSSLVLEL